MTSASTELAVQTLSWINEQLLLELDRQIAQEIRPTSAFWRRQWQAVCGLVWCGVNLVTLRAFS